MKELLELCHISKLVFINFEGTTKTTTATTVASELS